MQTMTRDILIIHEDGGLSKVELMRLAGDRISLSVVGRGMIFSEALLKEWINMEDDDEA